MNFENEGQALTCKECGEFFTDTHFSSDYCDDCLQQHEQEDELIEDDE